MIDAKDLMLNNWVDVFGMHVQITRLGHTTLGYKVEDNETSTTYSSLNPIELSPDILIACGFEFDDKMKHWQHPLDESGVFIQQGLRVRNKEGLRVNHFTDGYFVETYYSGIEVKSLHQLQNLYKLLCGKELEIKL